MLVDRNHFTLFHRIRILDNLLKNGKYLHSFTHRKNRLECDFNKQNSFIRIAFDSGQGNFDIFQSNKLSLPKKHVKIFKNHSGGTVTTCELHKMERVFQVTLSIGDSIRILRFQCIPNRGNVFLLANDEIFHFKKNIVPVFSEYFSAVTENTYKKATEHLIEKLVQFSQSDITFQHFVRETLPFFGGVLTREIERRTGLSYEKRGKEFSQQEIQSVAKSIRSVLSECLNPSPNTALGKFNLIVMQSRVNGETRNLETTLHNFRKFALQLDFEKEKRQYQRQLKKKLNQNQKKLFRLREQQENSASADKFQYFGDMLLAHTDQIKKGTNQFLSKEEPIKIDPKLSPIENAQWYYKHAKKSRRGVDKIEKQIEKTNMEIKTLHRFLAESDVIETWKELQNWTMINDIDKKRKTKNENLDRKPYKRYEKNGYEIFVGRSNRDNDTLTCHISKPHDLWLHAQGVGGSHVVIRNPQNQDVPRPVIYAAARLAAENSKAKHSGVVPVVYTLKKYVSKPRKSLPGIVRIEREKTIFVDLYQNN